MTTLEGQSVQKSLWWSLNISENKSILNFLSQHRPLNDYYLTDVYCIQEMNVCQYWPSALHLATLEHCQMGPKPTTQQDMTACRSVAPHLHLSKMPLK